MIQADIALDPMAACGVTLDLPWPMKELNPNARVHHHELARRKKSFRAACYVATKAAKIAVGPGRHSLFVEFFPPDQRKRDRDNLLASMKPGIDGVAEALGINDCDFDPIAVSVSKYMTFAGVGRVRLHINPYRDQKPVVFGDCTVLGG